MLGTYPKSSLHARNVSSVYRHRVYRDTFVCLRVIFLQGQDSRRPLVIGVGASSWLSPTKGVTKQAAPTKLRQALTRGVLRESGGTQHRSVMVKDLNEYRTTVCCSKCGGRTTAPLVCDYRTHKHRRSTRLRECPACKQQEQGGEGGAAQSEGGKEGDHAAVLAQSASVKKPQPAFQMHRDLNAAWNLWNVLAAEYARLPRPAYLTQPPAA